MSNPTENPLDWMKSFGAAELKKQATRDAEVVKAATEVKALEGAFNLKGINLGKFKRSGSSDKAPDNYRILLVNVEEFIAQEREAKEARDVTILSDTKFSVKAYQSVKIAEAHSKIGGDDKPDPMTEEEINELIKSAESSGRKNVRAYRTDVELEAWTCAVISCFNKTHLPTGSVVEIMGIEANSFFSDGKKSNLPGRWLGSLNAQSIIKSFDDKGDAMVNCKHYGVLDKVRLPTFNPDDKDYETYVVPFETTLTAPDKEKPGHISFLQNSTSEEDYAYKNLAKKDMMKVKYMMYRREWGERGFAKGKDKMVVTNLLQWHSEKGGSDVVIEKFGFPKVEDWQKFMSTNHVPVLAVCTIDQAETAKLPANPPTLVMNTWEYWPQLQDYLLTMCPRVDSAYVLSKIGSKRTEGYIERDNPAKRNLLNDSNMDKQGEDNVMTGSVVALSTYTGWMQDFLDANCEFRVMIDVQLDLAQRIKFKDMSIEDCKKVLSCADDAPIKLSEPPACYYWAVKPKSDENGARAMDLDDDEVAPPAETSDKDMDEAMELDKDDKDDDEEDEPPKRKRGKGKEEEDDDDDDDDEEEPQPKKKSSSKSTKTKKKKLKIGGKK